jgi:hypothetical protein
VVDTSQLNWRCSDMLTFEHYFAAVESGDAATLAAFFAQQAAHPQVYAVERAALRRAGDEWVLPFDPIASSTTYTRRGTLVEMAIQSNHYEAIEWLFSAAAIDTIGSEVLTTVLPQACLSAMQANALLLLDLLLTSPAFLCLLSLTKQQDLLSRLLHSISPSTSSDSIELLIAHGACVNPTEDAGRSGSLLTLSVGSNNPDALDTVIQEGAFSVGTLAADAGIVWDKALTQHVLLHPTRPALGTTVPLHETAVRRCPDTTRLWLELGFSDVDARDSEGRTPLMRMSRVDKMSSGRVGCASTSRLLLEYGASATAKDTLGWSLLWFAVGANFPELVRLVLEHGANPNEPIACGSLVPLHLMASRGFDEDRVAQLWHLMEFGADPFVAREDGLTAVDLLRQSETGRAFINAHPQWFAGP